MVDCLPPMILEQLRVHTAAAHQALENEVHIEQAARDLKSYRRLLERFYGFHQPFEARIGALPGWNEVGYDPRSRLKSPWLRDDLESLGLGSDEIQELPLCGHLPEIRTIAQGFGCAYVMEGSTLGGRHIARLLENGPGSQLPRRFFQSYGSEVGMKWKEFCASLEEFSAECPHSETEIIRAADTTFTCFREWVK